MKSTEPTKESEVLINGNAADVTISLTATKSAPENGNIRRDGGGDAAAERRLPLLSPWEEKVIQAQRDKDIRANPYITNN